MTWSANPHELFVPSSASTSLTCATSIPTGRRATPPLIFPSENEFESYRARRRESQPVHARFDRTTMHCLSSNMRLARCRLKARTPRRRADLAHRIRSGDLPHRATTLATRSSIVSSPRHRLLTARTRHDTSGHFLKNGDVSEQRDRSSSFDNSGLTSFQTHTSRQWSKGWWFSSRQLSDETRAGTARIESGEEWVIIDNTKEVLKQVRLARQHQASVNRVLELRSPVPSGNSSITREILSGPYWRWCWKAATRPRRKRRNVSFTHWVRRVHWMRIFPRRSI